MSSNTRPWRTAWKRSRRRTRSKTAFLGDGLQVYRTHEIVGHVCSIRNLTTSYTPYQPERSQGTLITHWIYQSTLAQLTGFEAVNSSLYERASALFEAAVCAVRMADAEANTVLVAGNLMPSDLEVLRTHVAGTSVNLEFLAPEDATGRLSAATASPPPPRVSASSSPPSSSRRSMPSASSKTSTP